MKWENRMKKILPDILNYCSSPFNTNTNIFLDMKNANAITLHFTNWTAERIEYTYKAKQTIVWVLFLLPSFVYNYTQINQWSILKWTVMFQTLQQTPEQVKIYHWVIE